MRRKMLKVTFRRALGLILAVLLLCRLACTRRVVSVSSTAMTVEVQSLSKHECGAQSG